MFTVPRATILFSTLALMANTIPTMAMPQGMGMGGGQVILNVPDYTFVQATDKSYGGYGNTGTQSFEFGFTGNDKSTEFTVTYFNQKDDWAADVKKGRKGGSPMKVSIFQYPSHVLRD
jgi:hypothetical protein